MPVARLSETFYEITGNRLSNLSYLKLFNILEDTDGTRYLNIWRSYSLNDELTDDTVYYESYEVDNDDWWDNISYYNYETPRLWWLCALMNDIMNPFEELEAGDNIKILRDTYIYQLIRELETIQEL